MPARALVLLLPFGLAASDLSCRQSLRFVHDGLPREVKVYTPRCGGDDAFANSSLPLLFAVHCFGCTFAQMEHWEAEAREYGFVLVLPLESSRGSGFNAGPCCGAAMRVDVPAADRPFVLGCGHCFHAPCLAGFCAKQQGECPSCGKPADAEDVACLWLWAFGDRAARGEPLSDAQRALANELCDAGLAKRIQPPSSSS